MEKCDGCSCELNNNTKFNMTALQKIFVCRRTKSRLITLTEVIFYGTLFSYIYYKNQINSLKKFYKLN